jgi:hypothetical protein
MAAVSSHRPSALRKDGQPPAGIGECLRVSKPDECGKMPDFAALAFCLLPD